MLHVSATLKSIAFLATQIGDLENGMNVGHNGYNLASYLGGPGFESRPGDWQS
jgi:hypothetical protein